MPRQTKAKLTFTCIVCSTEFSIWPSQVKHRNAGKYCSRSCYDTARSESKLCTVCGKEYFLGRQHRKNDSNKYCSPTCQHIGQRGEHYKENRSTYPKSFKKAREEVIEFQKGRCLFCGKPGKDVHHVNYDKQDCCFFNLVLLCKSCHTKTNYERDFWEERIKHIIGCW